METNEFFLPTLAVTESVPFSSLGTVVDIAPVGIAVTCPPRPCDGYPALVADEMALKRDFLAGQQPVQTLLLTGYPMRQFGADQLTELIFRFGTRFNLLNSANTVCGIALFPEHCTPEYLALLKGLAFNRVDLQVDATVAGPDRSIKPVQRAGGAVTEFAGIRLHSRVLFSDDTHYRYLARLMDVLITGDCMEIELFPALPPVSRVADYRQAENLFRRTADMLQANGYAPRGDRHFSRNPIPEGGLRYGDWGFYDGRITTWLGMGPAATGIVQQHMYRNARPVGRYLATVARRIQPITEWTCSSWLDQTTYRIAQDLFCYHRFTTSDDEAIVSVLGQLSARGWIQQEERDYVLTPAGRDNLRSLCRFIIHHRVL